MAEETQAELDQAVIDAAAAAAATTTDGSTKEASKEATASTDASKAGQITVTNEADLAALSTLADLGITPANAQDFVRAKAALDQLNTTISTDPDTMLEQLRTSNPDAYFKTLDAAANRFLQHFPPDDKTAGKETQAVSQKSDPRVDALTRKVDQLESEKRQETQQVVAKQIETEYNTRVDGLVKQVADKVPNVNKDYLRLKTSELVAKDPVAMRHINQGIFTDIPRIFVSAASTIAAETKSSTQAEIAKRQAVQSNGVVDVTPGAQNVAGTDTRDDWEDAVTAFAGDLKAAPRD